MRRTSALVPPRLGAGPLTGSARRSYYTDFGTATENPLSEGGRWTTGSAYNPACQIGSGLCWGGQTGDERFEPRYNDSMACLTGFGNNHRVEITISLTGTPAGDLEVECWLGAKYGPVRNVGTNPGDAWNNPTDVDGIEVNLTYGKWGILGYVGRFLDGNYNQATDTPDDFSAAAASHGVHDGDKLCAQLTLDHSAQTGTVIVSMIRATTGVETTLITTPPRNRLYRIGNPGLGFYRENDSPGVQDDPRIYSITAFYATEI